MSESLCAQHSNKNFYFQDKICWGFFFSGKYAPIGVFIMCAYIIIHCTYIFYEELFIIYNTFTLIFESSIVVTLFYFQNKFVKEALFHLHFTCDEAEG